MWEEISTDAFQATLRDIFTSNACLSTNHELQAKFSAVLDTPIENEEARQDVKRKLCALLGLITQKADPRRASLAEGIEFQRDVEVSLLLVSWQSWFCSYPVIRFRKGFSFFSRVVGIARKSNTSAYLGRLGTFRVRPWEIRAISEGGIRSLA